MGDTTGISWADATFNPWIGCDKVSPGCAHCYAETMVTTRMGSEWRGTWGADGERRRTSESNWAKPLQWERGATRFANAHGGRRRAVFCASMADVFEPRPELASWRDDLFREVIRNTPSLDWMILTKRPEEARDYLTALYDRSEDVGGHAAGASAAWPPLSNVWIGVSIENARHAYRADVLREIPAAVRFISAEPLLGSLIAPARSDGPAPSYSRGAEGGEVARDRSPLDLTGIDWVIVGGESGGPSAARPMHPQWARELRDAVLAADGRCDTCGGGGQVDDYYLEGSPMFSSSECPGCDGTGKQPRPAFHMKQFGSWAPVRRDVPRVNDELLHLDGSRIKLIPELLQSLKLERGPDNEYVSRVGSVVVRYAGPLPTSGGKLLDGHDWCERPGLVPVPA